MTSITDSTFNVFSNYYSSAKTETSSSESSAKKSEEQLSNENNISNSYTNKTSLGRYVNSTSSNDISSRKIFEKISIDLGGDGKKITESQLNSYIKKAEEGNISIPDEELTALKDLQENWSEISNNSDKISYSNIVASGKKDTLLSVIPEKEDEIDYKSIADDATIDAYSKVVNAALNFSTKKDSSTLSSTLKQLLSGTTDENDDVNANSIATIINLMEEYKKASTIELEA